MYKLVDLVIILVALVEMRMGHLVDFQIKSSFSPLTVKMVLKWEVAMGGLLITCNLNMIKHDY